MTRDADQVLAEHLAGAARAAGVGDLVRDELDRAMLPGAIDPRPGEGREDEWRGEERDDTEYSDPTPAAADGGLSLSDQEAIESWSRLHQREKHRRRRRHDAEKRRAR